MRIVTSGSAFLDIDAYAGCVAYAELLNLTGVLAQAASSAPLNESVTQEIRSWTVPFTADYEPGLTDDFALIDISEAAFFDPIVDRVRVREVIDHHTGFEAEPTLRLMWATKPKHSFWIAVRERSEALRRCRLGDVHGTVDQARTDGKPCRKRRVENL